MFNQIFKKYFNPGTIHVFVFSFLIFIVLNVIENVIHYNIGKFHNGDNGVNGVNGVNYFTGYHFTNPSRGDWIRIIVIMLVFAILQGVFTSYYSLC